jgi:hypothetical protein
VRRPGVARTWALALVASAPLAARAGDVPPEAAEDVKVLLENAIAVARATLAKEGRFHPFAFFMASDGRVQRVTPKQDVALPSPDEVFALLQAAFRQRAEAGECRAVALVADVVISLPGGGQGDALQVGVEHRDGYCQDFFHPYEREPDGTLRFGEPLSRRRRGAVFPGCGAD